MIRISLPWHPCHWRVFEGFPHGVPYLRLGDGHCEITVANTSKSNGGDKAGSPYPSLWFLFPWFKADLAIVYVHSTGSFLACVSNVTITASTAGGSRTPGIAKRRTSGVGNSRWQIEYERWMSKKTHSRKYVQYSRENPRPLLPTSTPHPCRWHNNRWRGGWCSWRWHALNSLSLYKTSVTLKCFSATLSRLT